MQGPPITFANDGAVAFILYWLGSGLMLSGIIRAFVLGCKEGQFAEALVSGWFLIFLGALTNDAISPVVAEKLLGPEKGRLFWPETPGTIGILCVGWWPPIAFYWLGRGVRAIFQRRPKQPRETTNG